MNTHRLKHERSTNSHRSLTTSEAKREMTWKQQLSTAERVPLFVALLALSLVACGEEPADTPHVEVPCGIVSPPIAVLNDTGTPCDPEAQDSAGCQHECLVLESGEGVCINTCDEGSCPAGFRCNTFPWDETLCLPNLACGDLSYEGTCEGSTLTYCGPEGPLSYACAAPGDTSVTCGWVEGVGNDCVSTASCEDLPAEGRCEGSVHTMCTEWGVESVDCASWFDDLGDPMVCTVGDDWSGCISEHYLDGCSGLAELNQCEGTTFSTCGPYGLEFIDCSEERDDAGMPMECGLWSMDELSCVPAGYTESCGEIPLQGLCVNETLIRRCDQEATPAITEVDCADLDRVCALDAWGEPLCAPADGGDCGDITWEGQCQGDTFVYCEDFTLTEIDCVAEGLTCAVDSFGAATCAPLDGGSCGDITYAGICEGDTLLYCSDFELISFDCSAEDLVCAVDSWDEAYCVPEEGDGCGDVTYLGYCDEDTVVYCSDFELIELDCAAEGLTCGYEDDEVGFNCQGAPEVSTGTAMTVSASYRFEKPALSKQGLGALSQSPVRQALVSLMRASDDSELTRGFTNSEGQVSLSFETSEPVYLLLRAVGDGERYTFSVRDCPMEKCTPNAEGNVYGHQSSTFTPDTAGTVLDPAVLSVASGVAGAFNLFDLLVRGADFVHVNHGSYPGPHQAQWKAGETPACGTSCYKKGTLYIRGDDADTDEFDDAVVLHEYGHFLEDHFSKSDSPKGQHDGSKTNPLLAWSEGYATYVGCAINDSAMYIDTKPSFPKVVDIDYDGLADEELMADLNHPKGMRQPVSEFMVAEILWKIARGYTEAGAELSGQGDAPIFDVLFAYFKSPQMADRGVKGIDFVDFLDGWFWRGHGQKGFIEGLVVDKGSFPYDFQGPLFCEESPAPEMANAD